MHSTILLASAVTLAQSATASPLSTRSDDNGYWDVNVSSSSAASGYRWNDIYAVFSGTPEQQSHCYWLYDPMERSGTTTCDGTDFNAHIQYDYETGGGKSTRRFAGTLTNSCQELVTIHQMVTLSGVSTALTGSALVPLNCGLGGNGRNCEGSVRVAADVEGPGAVAK
jgi:hypothetical protein